MFKQIGSIIAAAAVIIAAVAKFMQGEVPSMAEVSLAIGVLAAAFGFQKAA